MNREDVIRMAREAGFEQNSLGMTYTSGSLSKLLERFAALVAAHIRETEFKPDWNNYRQGFADGAAEEREACAKVFDDMANQMVADMEPSTAVFWVRSKAAEIRARGQE